MPDELVAWLKVMQPKNREDASFIVGNVLAIAYRIGLQDVWDHKKLKEIQDAKVNELIKLKEEYERIHS